MYLERLLQINMATLAVLGASLLGMGQRSEGPPLLVALAAVVSVWLTDITGWFRLDHRVANVLMLLAAAASLPRSFPVENELQALDFAWFLIYLQILFLFQAKDERKYWLLVMFSLLQVIVATLFNQGIWFGILLAVYMLLGFSAMTLLLLYRQWRRYQPRDEGSGLVCLPGGDDRAGVGADLLGRLGRMALHTMALTLVLFFAVPRFGQTTWRGAVATPKPLVGYSDKVALGTLGQTIEDPGKVMKVRFYDPANDNYQPVAGDVYLQGAILMTYDRGQWQTGLPSWNRNTELLERADPSPPRDLVVQDITIEALDHNELFYVAPFVSLKPTIYLSFNHALQRLLRREEDCAREVRYKLGTTAIQGGVQKPLTPRNSLDSTKQALQFPTVDDAPALPNLVKLAQRWIDQSGLPAKDRLGRARYLERQLAMSGQFQYRLVGQPRDPKLDPIEDFVTKHPAGHCEYFATALTLMLRSQGIPARMVVGYKCDEWNPVGGYYQVRQLHAHTWVEAYLLPGQIPPDLMHGGNYWHWKPNGGWLRLDPTPAGASFQRQSSWLSPLHDTMDWLDWAWSNYVLELDAERQREAIYGPICRAAQAVWREVTDPGRWRAMLDATLTALYLDQLSGVAAWLAAAAAGILATALLAAAGWLFWLLGRRLRARAAGNHGRAVRRRTPIEFYRRFETLLARQGILRAPGQTQREFAAAAGPRLALLGHDPQLGRLPGVVAEAFYHVRFGGQPLDSLQAQAVEHAIQELMEMMP